jgi:hypothetical protein
VVIKRRDTLIFPFIQLDIQIGTTRLDYLQSREETFAIYFQPTRTSSRNRLRQELLHKSENTYKYKGSGVDVSGDLS